MELDIDFSSSLFGGAELVCSPNVAKYQPASQDWVFSRIHDSPPHLSNALTNNRAPGAWKRKKSRFGEESDSSVGCEEEQRAGEDVEWTTNHPSVGKKIEKVFEMQGTLETYVGQVISYLPPSKLESADQLYKIIYDDDDIEDFDQAEYNEGRMAFQQEFVEKH